MRLIKLTLVMFTTCYLLTACGQMGPLYLPPPAPVKSQDTKTTANDTTTQSTQDKT